MTITEPDFLTGVINGLDLGVVVLDSEKNVVYWNQFMSKHSGIKAHEIENKNLFQVFEYLPREWLELKIDSVRLLKSFSFVSWKQRPYLFKFIHRQTITGDGVDFMYQDCTLLPLKIDNTSQAQICLVVRDVTELALAQKKIDELEDVNKTLEEITNLDPLTAIHNRRYVERRIETEFYQALRNRSTFSIALLDIDHFKLVNDEHGHLVGDEVLIRMASTINDRLRTSDVFGRYGGEEFLIVLPETSDEAAASLILRLKDAVEANAVQSEGQEIKITCSCGISQYRPDVSDYFQMIHEADQALYFSKKSGRNIISRFRLTGCVTYP